MNNIMNKMNTVNNIRKERKQWIDKEIEGITLGKREWKDDRQIKTKTKKGKRENYE